MYLYINCDSLHDVQSCFPLRFSLKFTVFCSFSFPSSMYRADNSRISCLCPCVLHKHYSQEVEHKELHQTNTTLRFAHDDLKTHRNYNREETTASSENFCVTPSPKPRQEFMQHSGVKIAVLKAQLTDLPLGVYRTRVMVL